MKLGYVQYALVTSKGHYEWRTLVSYKKLIITLSHLDIVVRNGDIDVPDLYYWYYKADLESWVNEDKITWPCMTPNPEDCSNLVLCELPGNELIHTPEDILAYDILGIFSSAFREVVPLGLSDDDFAFLKLQTAMEDIV